MNLINGDGGDGGNLAVKLLGLVFAVRVVVIKALALASAFVVQGNLPCLHKAWHMVKHKVRHTMQALVG